MAMNPTTRELAKLTGLSQSTISRALRNHPSVQARTKEKILKIAQENGYQRNPLVSAFMSHLKQTTRRISYKSTLGLLCHLPLDYWNESTVHQRFFRGAKRRAKSLGYEIDLFFIFDEKLTASRLNQILVHRNINGLLLILNPSQKTLPLKWEQFSILAQGYRFSHLQCDRIAANTYHLMKTMLDVCHQKGYRRIAYLWHPWLEELTEGRLSAAFLNYQESIPSKNRIPLKFSGYEKYDDHLSELEKWQSRFKPDLIISDSKACETIYEKQKKQIPKKFGLASFDITHGNPEVSGIDQHYEEIGEIAASQLIGKVEQNLKGIPKIPSITLGEVSWAEGKTTI